MNDKSQPQWQEITIKLTNLHTAHTTNPLRKLLTDWWNPRLLVQIQLKRRAILLLCVNNDIKTIEEKKS